MNNDNKNKVTREFKLTTFALKNKNTVFLVTIAILIFGFLSYNLLPKELFPEVNIPTVLIQTIYPGNPPEDIENLITRQIEKQVKTVKGIKKLTSTSTQDVSLIFVEFNSNVEIKQALQDVKDEVDKAKSDLPESLDNDPVVSDIDFSEFPVININISGEYSVEELKDFAEYLQDEIETVYEVSKVNIKGINEKEIQINVDPVKLDAYQMSFGDIENAILMENVSISGGEIRMGDIKRSIRTIGEFKTIKDIEDIIVKSEGGNIIYLRDLATVVNTFEEAKSYARLNKQTVVSIQVVKKGGENLLKAIDETFKILEKSKKNGSIPDDINISITNDQSKEVRSQLINLQNSIYMGVIFVVVVLFFFLGLRNAIFVGVAIPMSMFLSFAILGAMGATINMMVLFSLILALGMLVDNAIVVVENIYRFTDQGYSVFEAAKQAVGEIAFPIISSTATTLAAFFPLLLWEGIMGEFMKYMPITLIIVLSSSLFVALVITPVLASTFIKKGDEVKKPNKKKTTIIAVSIIAFAVILYFAKQFTYANLLSILAILILLNTFILFSIAQWFQNVFLVKLEQWYLKLVQFAVREKNSYFIVGGTTLLLFLTIIFFGMRGPNVLFFPANEPQYINIIAEFPVSTDVAVTDSIIKIVNDKLYKTIEPYQDIIESVLTTVGEGAKREMESSVGSTPNKALTTIKFVDFEYRKGVSTSDIMKIVSDTLLNKYPGIDIFVEKNQNGPPTGYPINIEITGKDLHSILTITDTMSVIIEEANIEGIENLKIDLEIGKPEILIDIDRDKARRFGLSTAFIASTIRTSLFGKEATKFKVDEEEYPIQIRFNKKSRYNLATLLNQKIAFRNNKGQLMHIPISSVADIKYSSSFGSIKRKDMKKTITLYSNVIEGYNANEINAKIQKALKNYHAPNGYEFGFTGEQEEQEKTSAFLMNALAIAIALILIILVSQFNSFIKPFIIIASVLFSTIGVFGGIATFKMDFVILMTGIGIISLAGVVVNNAIVLIDYIDFLKLNRKKELGLSVDDNLPMEEITQCIVLAGKTRLRPVLLTAITTILGLLPMATGMNINFETMLSQFNPQIYFGGDNASFWGPMSWTVIFGLTFATFLTLFVVPSMYKLANEAKLKIVGFRKN